MMIAVEAADLLKNADLDALFLKYAEAEPQNDAPSCESVQTVFRELALTWWIAEAMEWEEPE